MTTFHLVTEAGAASPESWRGPWRFEAVRELTPLTKRRICEALVSSGH